VILFAYTGGDGMFGACGNVASEEQFSELRKFMESTTHKAHFLKGHIGRRTDYFELGRGGNRSEPLAPGNGTQPIRTETNPAAGSIR